MIIWQSFGILGVLLPIVGYVLGAVLATSAGASSLGANTWAGPVGMVIGAGAAWFMARSLDRPGRVLMDPETGQQVVFRKKHTFFFVPMEYVALAMGGIAMVMLFVHRQPR